MNKKKILSIAYFLLTFLIIIFIAFLDPNIKNIGKAFNHLNIFWISIAFFCMFVFWALDAFILIHATVSMHGTRVGFWKAMKIIIVGQYYNSITPFSSGGPPVQAYYLTKEGVPVGYSSSVFTIKFLLYQTTLVFYCILSMIIKLGYISSKVPQILWFSMAGFIMHITSIILVILIILKKSFVSKASEKIIQLLYKWKFVKNLEKVQTETRSHIDDFHQSASFIKKNVKDVLIICFYTFLEFTVYFGITYFIYRAFGLNTKSFIDIVTIQAFLYLAASFFPTPGGAGASEGGFYVFFKLVFPKELLFLSMLIWRVISYYLNIIAGGIIILIDAVRKTKKPKENEKLNGV